jgi:dihydrofolate reductase
MNTAMSPAASTRKLVLKFWVGLDGNSIDPDTEIYRLMDEITDDEQEEYFVNRLKQPGTHLMGRVSFEGMMRHFPTATDPVAEVMNQAEKAVVSSTLRSAGWAGTTILSGDLAEAIAALKAEPGGDIMAHGGTQLARSLIQLGLVDEYQLWVLPAAAGEGAPLFTGMAHPVALRLVSSTVFPSGILELVYVPAGQQEAPATAA